MSRNIEGKIVVITGASSGLGESTCGSPKYVRQDDSTQQRVHNGGEVPRAVVLR